MTTIGWIGSICLSLCGAPQAWHCYKTKSAAGISEVFLGFWGVGELMLFIYVLPMHDLPLIMNYFVNMLFIGVIAKYKLEEK